MERSELKAWAKKKREGNIIKILVALIVPTMILSFIQAVLLKIFGIDTSEGAVLSTSESIISSVISLLYALANLVIGVNVVAYMVRIIKDKETTFKSLFDFSGNIVRTVLTMFLNGLFVFLWSLLLVIPGIVKTYSYALVQYILADERYKDLSAMEVLKLSEKIMKGHRMDLFKLQLSFIGWFILCGLTFGILYIWVAPYFTLATTKFLQDLLDANSSGTSVKEGEVVKE